MKTIFSGLILLAGTMVGDPVVLNQPTVRINQSIFGSSPEGTVSISVSGQQVGNSLLDATACFDGYCPGQALPGVGPNFFVNDPITLKFTDLTYACNNTLGFCSSNQGAFFDWLDGDLTNINFPLTLTIDGTAPNGSKISFGVEWETCDLTGNNCEGNNIFALKPTFNGDTFSGSFSLGSITLRGQTHFELDTEFDFLTGGQTVSMPGSMAVTLGTPGPSSSTPEPATIFIGFSGLILLVIHGRLSKRFR